MVSQSLLEQVAGSQLKTFLLKDTGLNRQALNIFPDLDAHALIVSGIRRSGKSTLLHQLLQKRYAKAFYLNFEDARLYDFENSDFIKLDELVRAQKKTVLFFDEIQIIKGWELFIRQKLDEGCKIILTGSNASLLSHELGTKLTGRHITKELFPFSYNEFLKFTKTKKSERSLVKYLQTGGFPEYVKRGDTEILHHLFEDILIRDIAVRYGVRDVRNLKIFAAYLLSNIGKPVTANKLKGSFQIKATSTIMEYFSYLEQSYLFFFVPKFSYSVKKQAINPRKVYAIDTGLVNVNSISLSEDYGRKLENLVFIHLRTKYKEVYYFQEKRECDFVIIEKGRATMLVQVCYDLNVDNMARELDGLYEAMDTLGQKQGYIVTLSQTDKFKKEDKQVTVLPAWKFMSENVNSQ